MVYSYNFSSSVGQIYLGNSGSKHLAQVIRGMIAGDADANNVIELTDKSEIWESNAGLNGYLSSDLNLDGNADNKDKDDYWLPNLGKGSTVPQ